MTDLDEYLDDTLRPDGAPDGADPDRPWQIEDEGAADWAARKVQQARRRIVAKRAERDRVVAAADDWLARETKTLEDDAVFFEGKLADWLRREIDADPKGKVSRALPSGVTVKRTPPGESLVVDDEDVLVRFLAENEDTSGLVEWVPKYSKADVKKLVTKDGLKVDGVHIEPGVHGWKVDV